jgi:hypothetical protein
MAAGGTQVLEELSLEKNQTNPIYGKALCALSFACLTSRSQTTKGGRLRHWSG